MIKVILLGQGMVATHLAVGLERIKNGELPPYGVPLANFKLPYDIKDIVIVESYDVDREKIGRSIFEIAEKLLKSEIHIPTVLENLRVKMGVHLGSVRGLISNVEGLDSTMPLTGACKHLVEEWKSLDPDIIVNVITTEYGIPFEEPSRLKEIIMKNDKAKITASQFYAYTAYKYAMESGKKISFINVIPTPLANDPAFISLYSEARSLILGDDGATGATPITCDLLEHMAERNRKVNFIVQFNIGGNLDFLALTLPKKNLMKERTKSSIVKDILGYDAPHFIKPTGYLAPLGDKKFVSLHIEYLTFNGLTDDLYLNLRMNDSPALAGQLVDLIRLGKIAVEQGFKGTLYEINAFYMKKPAPKDAKSISKIEAYYNLLRWLKARNSA